MRLWKPRGSSTGAAAGQVTTADLGWQASQGDFLRGQKGWGNLSTSGDALTSLHLGTPVLREE